MMTGFLVLHGLGGSTDGHWQEWLVHSLKNEGRRVWFPQFPQWDHPVKETWLAVLDQELRAIPADQPLTVITHSLGCILWLHYAARKNVRTVEQLIMVCPPSEHVKKPEIQNFFPLPEDKTSIKRIAKQSMLILSSNDPFLPRDEMKQYFAYRIPCFIFPEQGHINTRAGYGPWPWMLHFLLEGSLEWPVL
ncbi:alpha/beta hydrolase [Sporolactobacillus sp. CPB3-1]|uniref:Alpha/beta hydrolase n=1 Tax=Sporolactobacillus mangiferae TaxID=2940498 RepID=A0ABT0M8U9_9BACL|nr:alpha/beta fold hydrolase [Sporolactobacillus mangiferae]MCL1631018.1 alpha/beta hydrolase [Sporolactobacillus mangiferae]